MKSQELGIAEGRPLTVTRRAHLRRRTAEQLRAPRDRTHGGGRQPPKQGFRYENLQGRADAFPLREAVVDFEGPVAIEAYTVAYRGNEPHLAQAACLTDDGRRTWGTLQDPALLDAMTREEFCGRRGRLDGHGKLGVA